MDKIKRLMEAANDLNMAAVEFAKRKSQESLKDGTALGLEQAALAYASAVKKVLDRE